MYIYLEYLVLQWSWGLWKYRAEIGKETKKQLVLDSCFETLAEKSVSWFADSKQWIKKVVSWFTVSNQWIKKSWFLIHRFESVTQKKRFLIHWFETTLRKKCFLVHFLKQKRETWTNCFEPSVSLPISELKMVNFSLTFKNKFVRPTLWVSHPTLEMLDVIECQFSGLHL